MTPFLDAIMTAMVIGGGALAIVYGLRFFPIAKARSDQLEFDLDVVPPYIKRSRAMAHDLDRETDSIREEVSRLKAKPRIRR